jgi:hypothetical protein
MSMAVFAFSVLVASQPRFAFSIRLVDSLFLVEVHLNEEQNHLGYPIAAKDRNAVQDQLRQRNSSRALTGAAIHSIMLIM